MIAEDRRRGVGLPVLEGVGLPRGVPHDSVRASRPTRFGQQAQRLSGVVGVGDDLVAQSLVFRAALEEPAVGDIRPLAGQDFGQRLAVESVEHGLPLTGSVGAAEDRVGLLHDCQLHAADGVLDELAPPRGHGLLDPRPPLVEIGRMQELAVPGQHCSQAGVRVQDEARFDRVDLRLAAVPVVVGLEGEVAARGPAAEPVRPQADELAAKPGMPGELGLLIFEGINQARVPGRKGIEVERLDPIRVGIRTGPVKHEG